MSRPDFDRCTKEATKLLAKQNVSNRILNIVNLNYDKTIIFDTIQNYCSYTKSPISLFLSEEKQILKDGCTLYDKRTNVYIVLYNANINYFEHLNWTLAHEIGHVYLGHTSDGDIEEVEAHYFASQLFMPEYSLFMTVRKYGSISSDDIVEIFGVSPEAASKRILTMRKRTSFDVSKISKEIWEAQRERVELYFNCKADGSDYRNTLEFWIQMKNEYEQECRINAYSTMSYI